MLKWVEGGAEWGTQFVGWGETGLSLTRLTFSSSRRREQISLSRALVRALTSDRRLDNWSLREYTVSTRLLKGITVSAREIAHFSWITTSSPIISSISSFSFSATIS